ncbi:hypothetical protein L1987_79818 [Smallanthus sonchifolius]|uniref:Uncharacterized protein n=1 Tax=Smallanthus sonchifolius TaxID=185202 RepID=A0ACB8YM53_9ASTR|nr:hypothetical protein L1987_79818 [Smallanthus sonchifolius]
MDSELQAIAGNAIYPPLKKLKPPIIARLLLLRKASASASSTYNPNPNQVVLVDSKENGIRLVHTLMACAEAVQQENFQLAEWLRVSLKRSLEGFTGYRRQRRRIRRHFHRLLNNHVSDDQNSSNPSSPTTIQRSSSPRTTSSTPFPIVQFLQAPVTTLIEYSGVLRPRSSTDRHESESESLISNNRRYDRSSSGGSGTASSNGDNGSSEVSIRIMGKTNMSSGGSGTVD